MARTGRPKSGKTFGVLALDIDATVLARLQGCAELMSGHGWKKTGIVERALTEYFDRLEEASGVAIPPPGTVPVVKNGKKGEKVATGPTPHPLMRR